MQKKLIETIIAETSIPKTKTVNILKAMFAIIKDELVKDNHIKILKFGTFSVTRRNQRWGRNIQTGEEIYIPPTHIVKMKISQDLKKTIAL